MDFEKVFFGNRRKTVFTNVTNYCIILIWIERVHIMDKREVYERLKELAKNDIVIDTFIRIVEQEVKVEMIGEYNQNIKYHILKDKFYKLVFNIINMQSERIKLLENELIVAKSMIGNKE
jgi:hypothetical protein